jgi:hypothetical protein
MAIGYKKRILSVTLSLELYEELKRIALKMDWTEKETLSWAIASGVDKVDNLDEMEKELSELISRKKELDLELESIIPDYRRLSSRNAALRYEYFETFSGNKTLTIKLIGAKAMNRSFKNFLKIEDKIHDEQEERTDKEMIERYIIR